MAKAENNRIMIFDNLKFLLIILMVVGHFADANLSQTNTFRSVYLFIYAFHMPLFIFISGLFHKNERIKSKVLSFISIGFLAKMVRGLYPVILRGGRPNFKLLSDSSLPWFMFALAVFVLLSYCFRNINKVYVLIMFVLLACFVGYDADVGDFLYLSRIIVFYPFYLLGQMVTVDKVLKVTKTKWARALSVVIIALWAVLCFGYLKDVYFLRPLFTGRNSFAVNELFKDWGILYRLLCYLITALLSFALISLMPNKNIPMFTKFGPRTLQVFFWHWPLGLVFVKYGLNDMLCATPWGQFGWLMIGVAISYIACIPIFSFPCTNVIKACREIKDDK